MVMQDDGTVEVRPEPHPGRAAARHSGAYIRAGVALLLYGAALGAWALYDVLHADLGVGDFLEGLFNPLAALGPLLFGPHAWALTVATAAVGGLLLARRRAARTAALLLGAVLLALSLREGVGLLHETYRTGYAADPLGGWYLATRVLELVASVVVLFALVPAGERPAPGPPGATGASRWHHRISRVCGVLFLIMGVLVLAWTAWGPAAGRGAVGGYLRGLVDASAREVPFGTDLAGSPEFRTVTSVVALLVLGFLACRARADVRGALLLLAATRLYLTVQMVVLLAVTGSFDASLRTAESTLSLMTTAYELVASTSVVILATGPRFSAYDARWAARPTAGLPGRGGQP
ncbi:hypothetical protein [Streptomyces sp. NPDC003077]|uniref:hypothetical protein n=1 Tax=Streptomyces sp. NPDC003077 TaxID=3154443 RepID=UPI0033B89296